MHSMHEKYYTKNDEINNEEETVHEDHPKRQLDTRGLKSIVYQNRPFKRKHEYNNSYSQGPLMSHQDDADFSYNDNNQWHSQKRHLDENSHWKKRNYSTRKDSRSQRTFDKPLKASKTAEGMELTTQDAEGYTNNHSSRVPIYGISQRPSSSSKRIVVDKIPSEFNNKESIRFYFQKFGSIQELILLPKYSKALIEYESSNDALAAYQSPEVIFGNRFVKVYWDKNEAPEFHQNVHPKHSYPANEYQTEMHPILHKKQALLKTKLELQKQNEVLLNKQIQEQKLILEKLSESSLKDSDKKELMSTLKSIQASIVTTRDLISTENKAQGTKSEETINTPITSNEPKTTPSVGPVMKYGYSSQSAFNTRRGGAAMSLPLRGSHTWIRGTSGGPSRGSFQIYPQSMRSMKLDLRSSVVLASGLPLPLTTDQQAIREHFKAFGAIISVSVENDAVLIHYSKRSEAELAVKLAPKQNIFKDKPFQISIKEGVLNKSHNSISLDSHTFETSLGKEPEEYIEDEPMLESEFERSWKR